MNNAFRGIELVGDNIKIFGITRVVSAEYSVCYMVCELDNPGCSRIHKQWNLGQIADGAPLCSQYTKVCCHALKSGFVYTFIENKDSPLALPLSS